MRLNRPGKPGLRGAATDFALVEAATMLSGKSTNWPDPTKPRSGCSTPIFAGHSIMHLDAPLKNATSGAVRNAGVETAPASSANPETETGLSLDLCPPESSHYGYD